MFTRPRLRSNAGCISCKRRRKKCDEQKPTCGSCQRVNRRCMWMSDEEHNAGHSLAKYPDPVFEFIIKRLRQEPSLSQSIDLSAYQDRICASHTLETCFKASNLPFDSIDTQRNGWSIQSTLVFAPSDDSLAWDCFVAHALMFVGNRYRDRGLFEAGLIKLSVLMRKIRSIIGDQSKGCNYDALAAINNLGTFSATRTWNDQFNSVHDSLALDHSVGMLAVLETMQPRQFQNDRALAFFEHTRYTKIATAILYKRETCLTSESWKTVPWAQAKHTKDSLHELIDLLGDVVELQAYLYIMTPYQAFDVDLSGKEVQEKVESLLSKLHDWRQSCESRLRSRLKAKYQAATSISSQEGASSSKQLDKVMGLCELGNFNMMLIYLCRFLAKDCCSSRVAGTCLGYSGMKYSPETRLASQMMPLKLPIEDSDRRAYIAAKEIVTVWEVIVSNEFIGIATIYLGLPLLLARAVLAREADAAFCYLDKALDQMPAFWSSTGW